MLFPFGIRNIVAMIMMTKGLTIDALLSSANVFCYSNPMSSARVEVFTSKGKDKIDDKCFAMRCKTGNGVNNNDTDLETMNKNLTKFVYLLPNETTAWHMGGSSNQRAERRDKDGRRIIKKYRTHKQQWMKETRYEWPSKCSTEDCTNKPTVGAHMVIDGKENVHLVPLCTNCNLNLSKNWIPDLKESGEIQSNNSFRLKSGTPCLELNHISREESVASNNSFSWIEMYDRLVLHVEKYNTTLQIYPVDYELGRWVSTQRFRYKTPRTITSKEINLLEDIGFSWNINSDNWDKNFALLGQYKIIHGGCNVPYRYDQNGIKLGRWLTAQRQDKKNNKLDDEKEKRLDDLGVIWEPLNDKWEENFKLLQQYKLKNGDCNVPYDYEENDINLGAWLNTQRQEKKKTKKNRLDAEKKKRLDDLGVIWEPLNDKWEENFKLLQQHKLKNGDCNIPKQYKENGINLGSWLDRQRQEKKKNRLHAKKENKLEDLGVIWEPYNEQWEENFKLFQQYKLKNGDCNVPQRYEENGVKLGIWLDTQRQDKKNNKLKGDKKEKLLDDLGVIWEPKLNRWEEKFELLEQFKNERGHCNVSTSQKEDEKYRALGQWLSDQRRCYRKGSLRNERQMKLDKLGADLNFKRK